MTVCALLIGTTLAVLASDPITAKEITMLLRNGETQQFIIQDTTRRKLLHPLSAQEEKELAVLGATPALMNALRVPENLAAPEDAARYTARREQELKAVSQQVRVVHKAGIPAPASAPAGQSQGITEGAQPSIKFTAVDGTEVDLARLRGKVVLIDFWATWCGPCMGEVPHVVAAYRKYHDRGFEIIGISLDHSKEKLLQVTAAKGMTWPQYFDGKGWKNDISTSFGIHGIPAMWLLNKNGVVVSTNARKNLDESIGRLLSE